MQDVGVQMAARSLLSLFRIHHPDLLRKKDRGKYHAKPEDVLQFGEERPMRNIRGAELLDAEEQIVNPTVCITRNVAAFIEVEDGEEELKVGGDEMRYEVVADEAAQTRAVRKPLLCRRVLSEEDLERLKELRVKNLMSLWNRKREEVGLEEDRESDGEIDIEDQVESATTVRRRRKELRKMQGAGGHQKAWDEYGKKKGGGSTNKEKDRNKPFMMTKYALKVMQKGRRNLKLSRIIRGQHKQRLKIEGKRAKRRRR